MKKIFIMFVALILALPLLFTPSIKFVNAAYNSVDDFGGLKTVTSLNFELIKSRGYTVGSTGEKRHALLDFMQDKSISLGYPVNSVNGLTISYFSSGQRIASIRFENIDFKLSHSESDYFYFHFPIQSATNLAKNIRYNYETESYPSNLNSMETFIEGVSIASSVYGHNPISFNIMIPNYGEVTETKQSLFNKVHAKMQEAYQITLENTTEAPVFLPSGVLIQLPTPSKLGHTFGGWFVDAALTIPFNTSTMPAENITIYAKWSINNYAIYLVNQGITLLPPISVQYGAQIPALPVLTWTGHTFAGWHQDAALTTPFTTHTMPAENITIYAKWTVNETGEPVDPVEPEEPTDPEEPGGPTTPERESLLDTLKRKMIDPFNEKVLKPIYKLVIEPLATLLGAPVWTIWAGLTFIIFVLIPAIIKKLLKNNKKTND